MQTFRAAFQRLGLMVCETAPEPDLERQAVTASLRLPVDPSIAAIGGPPTRPGPVAAAEQRRFGRTRADLRRLAQQGAVAPRLPSVRASDYDLGPWIDLMDVGTMALSLERWQVPYNAHQVPVLADAFAGFLTDLSRDDQFRDWLEAGDALVLHDPWRTGVDGPADHLKHVHDGFLDTEGRTRTLVDEEGVGALFGKTVEVDGAKVAFLLHNAGEARSPWRLQAVAEPESESDSDSDFDDGASTLSGTTAVGSTLSRTASIGSDFTLLDLAESREVAAATGIEPIPELEGGDASAGVGAWQSALAARDLASTLAQWKIPFKPDEVPRFAAAILDFLDEASRLPRFGELWWPGLPLKLFHPARDRESNPAASVKLHCDGFPDTEGESRLLVSRGHGVSGFDVIFGKTIDINGTPVNLLLDCQRTGHRAWILQAVSEKTYAEAKPNP